MQHILSSTGYLLAEILDHRRLFAITLLQIIKQTATFAIGIPIQIRNRRLIIEISVGASGVLDFPHRYCGQLFAPHSLFLYKDCSAIVIRARVFDIGNATLPYFHLNVIIVIDNIIQLGKISFSNGNLATLFLTLASMMFQCMTNSIVINNMIICFIYNKAF
nr:hypothetical protein [Paramuribaculum intestinale]